LHEAVVRAEADSTQEKTSTYTIKSDSWLRPLCTGVDDAKPFCRAGGSITVDDEASGPSRLGG